METWMGFLQRQVMTLKDSQWLGHWDRLYGYLSDSERPWKIANDPVILFVLYGNKQNTFGDCQRQAVSKFGAKSSNLNPEVELTNLQTGISGVGHFWTTQKYFATDRKPQKILSEKQNPLKNTLWNHYTFNSKSEAQYDNNEEQWLLKCLVHKTGPKKYC